MSANHPDAQVIAELANALQTAVPAAARLRQLLDAQVEDADALETALHQAMTAIRQLRPDNGGGTR
jgi:hypothetical protein